MTEGDDYQVRYQGDLVAKLNQLSKREQDELIAQLMAKTEEEQRSDDKS